jgi:hypothetical protein
MAAGTVVTRSQLALGVAGVGLAFLAGLWLPTRCAPAAGVGTQPGGDAGRESAELAPAPAPAAVLWVEVVSQDTGAALAEVDLAIALEGVRGHGGARVSALEGAVDRFPRTGADGLARFRLAPGAYTLQLSWGAGARGRRTVEVSALAPGEERRLQVKLPTAPDLAFRGCIVDEESGAPIPGAEVLLFEGDLWSLDWPIHRPARVVTELARTASDGGGCFELLGSSWKPELVRVRAAGFVPGFAPIVPGHSQAGDELVLELRRSASLELRIEEDGQPASGLSVSLLAESGLLRSGVSDEAGRCLVEDLPARVALRLRLARRGASAEPPELLSVEMPAPVLLPGQVHELRLRLERGADALRVEPVPR